MENDITNDDIALFVDNVIGVFDLELGTYEVEWTEIDDAFLREKSPCLEQ